MYKYIIRPILFQFDAEKVHYFTFTLIKFTFKIPLIPFFIRKTYSIKDSKLEKTVLGIKFNNPVGLAAGFDKNALIYNEFADLGFGFIEIGTITPKAQYGNPKKRLFRLLEDQGLINRMGFNNKGVEEAIKNLKENKKKIIIGGNIGNNTGIPNDQIIPDYLYCFKKLYKYVDYFVVNISCPNVGETSQLQDKLFLIELLNALQRENKNYEYVKPIVLKIGPDLNNRQLDEIIEVVNLTKIGGVIASNTSVIRNELKTDEDTLTAIGSGGLSGNPIKDRSTKIIKYLATKSKKSFAIIGVGGIHSENEALEKLEAGADLIQLYTGFIYEGPSLIKRINKSILFDIKIKEKNGSQEQSKVF